MTDFVPKLVATRYDFDITHKRGGHWTARDRDGLTGGTFLTRKDAMRFALGETGGDRRHVHLVRAPRLPISLRQNPPGQTIRSTAR